jgi:hypothetical protein
MHCPICPAAISPSPEELARGRVFCLSCGGRFHPEEISSPGDSPFRGAEGSHLVTLPELSRPDGWTDESGRLTRHWRTSAPSTARAWWLTLALFVGSAACLFVVRWLFSVHVFAFSLLFAFGMLGVLWAAFRVITLGVEELFLLRNEELSVERGELLVIRRYLTLRTSKRIRLAGLEKIVAKGRLVELHGNWSCYAIEDHARQGATAAEWLAERLELERLRATG